ncbi:MAG TPA: FtsX-like permease family protein [Longimicrobiales bacterium]|nr:FtsX-like permease family protein [Longimicrobiales bacterium]
MRGGERGLRLAVRLSRRLISWSLPPEDRGLLEELDELYRERVRTRSGLRAALWYGRQAVGFVGRVAVARARAELRATSAVAGVRHALRSLRRRPAWAFGAVATLAVGVGGVASVYAVADWVVLRPVPGVWRGEDVVVLRLGSGDAPPHVTWTMSQRDYETLRRELTDLRDLAAASSYDVHVRSDGATRRLGAAMVSRNYFEVLGVGLAAGRVFDDAAARDEVIVSHALASALAASSADALGASIVVNGRAVRVIGVAPPGFGGAELPGDAGLWFDVASLPLLDRSAPPDAASRGGYGLWRRMYGRLAPGGSEERVELAANMVRQRLSGNRQPTAFSATHFHLFADRGLGPDPSVRGSLRQTLTLLGGAAAFLLLLAVANVANLSAMDATSRQGALAIRFALGARRRTLAAQWLTESLLLGVAGAAAALVVGLALNAAFRSLRLDAYGVPLAELGVHTDVLLFTLLVGVVASLVAALPVAFGTGRLQVLSLLGRARQGGRRGGGVRSAFVVVQVALSLVLVAGAALMGRTVANLRATDVGFDVDDVVVFAFDPSLDGAAPAERLGQLARIEEALASRPGVIAAGFITPEPLRGGWTTAHVYPEGGSEEDDVIRGAAEFSVTPGFLRALGIDAIPPFRAGEVLITENVAARAYPSRPPRATEGLRLRRARSDAPLVIAGVVDDVRLHGRDDVWPFTLLTPLDTTRLDRVVTGWVRTVPGAAVAGAIREVLATHAPDLPVFDVATGRAALDRLSSQQVVLARVALLLGLLGLSLALVGLYAVLGRSVAERHHELGVRAALGATRTRLLREVALLGLRLGAIGCVMGLIAALIASRSLGSVLYEVDALDPLTHGSAALLVLVAAVLASLLPGARAMRVSPLNAIRDDL